MTVRIQAEDFDAGREIDALRQRNRGAGAIASFVGVVRGLEGGEQITDMTLEHYPGMTEKSIADIITQAQTRWEIGDALVVHRIGMLKPNEQIVLVVVAGAHRGGAFAACEFIMDYLKTRAPFWKKERTASGARWVEARTSDDHAAARWEK